MLNPLLLLPPEAAHRITLEALKRGLGPITCKDAPRLSFTLFGKKFTNPVGLAAGADKKAEALPGWRRMGFGFVEAGTVTLHPRAGNPQPRLWRIDGKHIVNWMGLPGAGVEVFVENLKEFQRHPLRRTLVVGASLASPDNIVDEFRKLSGAVAPLADYLTLNASCPNITHGAGSVKETQEQVRAVVAEAGDKPVLLKLGPTRDAESLKIMVEAALEAGAAGFVATNTVPFEKKDILGPAPFDWPENGEKKVGGYSGPLLLETACWMVKEIRVLVGKKVPVIGVGGIMSGADALRLMNAGANAVQIYTGLVYKGPGLVGEIKKAVLKRG